MDKQGGGGKSTVLYTFYRALKADYSQYNFLRRDLRQETACGELSRAVARHLSQKLNKVQLLRHATRDIHKWSTVSTLGARAVHVLCTCIALLVPKAVANMKKIANRGSLSQLVAGVACRVARSCIVDRP